MSIIDKEPTEFTAIALPPCRCGKSVAYTVNADGKPDGVVHKLPMCPDFEKRDPIAFVRWLRAGTLS